MKFTKIDRSTAASAAASTSKSTARYSTSSSDGSTVALSGIYKQIADLKSQLTTANATIKSLSEAMSSLGAKYLRKDTNDSNGDNTLTLGGAITDSVMSAIYDGGRGSFIGKGGDEWMVIVRNLANKVNKTTSLPDLIGTGITYDSSVISTTSSIASTGSKGTFSITNAIDGATARVKTIATKSSGVTILSQRLEYIATQVLIPSTADIAAVSNDESSIDKSTVEASVATLDPTLVEEATLIDATTTSTSVESVWEIPVGGHGDKTYQYTLEYTATYSVQVGTSSQTIRLSVVGTEGDGTTRYYGGAACQAMIKADCIKVTADGVGYEVKTDGIYTVSGSTETKVL